MTDVPHFALPFRFASPQAAVNEQDSVDEIADACLAVLLCPVGFRVELPGFGLEDPTFSSPAPDLDTIRTALDQWEPRAAATLSEYPDLWDALVAHVEVDVQVRTGGLMSSSYIPVPVDTTPTDLAGEAFDYLQGKVPGWQPANGNLESWMIEALAMIAGELRELTALVPDAIFAYYGASILGLPPFAAIPATARTTWKAVDQAGYTVPAGTVIAITPPATTTGYGFSLPADLVIPAGQDTVAAVECHALQAGAAASGLTGNVAVIDSLVYIAAVTLDEPTSGGQDAETSDAYLARLSALLTLLSPRPILPQDFAVIAQREVAGVARAVAVDLYNPGPPIDTDCPRCVTVAICDSSGQPCSAEVKEEVDELLQSQREVNFLVFVEDPTYTTIDVSFAAVCYPERDPDEVAGRIVTALQSYLSPGTWGVPPYGDTTGRSWLNATMVRFLEVTEQINRVDGVHYVDNSTQIGIHGGAMGYDDIGLSGVAPLPQPGTIEGTVTQETG